MILIENITKARYNAIQKKDILKWAHLLIRLLGRLKKYFKAGEASLSKQVYEDILRKFPKNKKAIQGYKKLKANLEFGSATILEPDSQKFKETIRNYESCQY